MTADRIIGWETSLPCRHKAEHLREGAARTATTDIGSLPAEGYGAVEIGVHRFHHPGDPGNVWDAKFIMLWQNKEGMWKVTRVISYEHNHWLLMK